MSPSREQLNRFLVDVFHHVLRAEERLLRQSGYEDLSISEAHVLQAIHTASQQGSHNARGIAQALGITPGSLTAAVNVLEKKGYVVRQRGQGDRRRVYLALTDKGLAAEEAHQGVHAQLVEAVISALTPQEAELLGRALHKVSQFFQIEGVTSP